MVIIQYLLIIKILHVSRFFENHQTAKIWQLMSCLQYVCITHQTVLRLLREVTWKKQFSRTFRRCIFTGLQRVQNGEDNKCTHRKVCALVPLISREIIFHIEGKVSRRSYILFTTISSGHSKVNLMADQRTHSWKMNELTMKKHLTRTLC